MLSICILGGCGLDFLPDLRSPSHVKTDDNLSKFIFKSAGSSEVEGVEAFKGYNIYYKLYNSTEKIESENFDSEGKALVTSEAILVNTKRFKLLRKAPDENSDSMPLIDVPTDSGNSYKEMESQYTINFNPIEDANISSTASEPGGLVLSNQLIYRNAWDSVTEENKNFTEILATDLDFSDLNPDGDIYIALYVLSYGLHELSDVYGTPVWLHYIKLPKN